VVILTLTEIESAMPTLLAHMVDLRRSRLSGLVFLAIVDSELQKTQFVLALAHSQRWFRLDNDGHRVFTNVLELLLHAKIALIHGLSP
jgi:hypothetical protein